MSKPTCSVDGCMSTVKSRGWCAKHCRRWERHGTLEGSGRVLCRSFEQQMAVYVHKTDTCWLWTGAKTSAGYGSVRDLITGKTDSAHAYVYRTLVAEVPDGYELNHICHSDDLDCPGGACPHRLCVNPEHLEPVTHQTNVDRSAMKLERLGMCKSGRHDVTVTGLKYKRDGSRHCLACDNEYVAWYERKVRPLKRARK